jgi:hypothetical protein
VLTGSTEVEIMQFFMWLRSCLAMVESGRRLHLDLCVMVAARTLAALVCGLLPDEASSSAGITKAHLHQLCERAYK